MEQTIQYALGVLGLLIAAAAISSLRSYVIFEHECGLLYRDGKFMRLLEPGRYYFLRPFYSVEKVDMRTRYLTIAGQELLSADNISLKVSLVVQYRIEDPRQALTKTQNYLEALYLGIQISLRDLVGVTLMDDLLQKRQEIGAQLLETSRSESAGLGVTLLSVSIKDIMFPGEIKNIYAQVVSARKEGLAALERARGETAALRSLANAARLLEENPALLQLRILQSLGSGSGNSLILNTDPQAEVLKKIMKKTKERKTRE